MLESNTDYSLFISQREVPNGIPDSNQLLIGLDQASLRDAIKDSKPHTDRSNRDYTLNPLYILEVHHIWNTTTDEYQHSVIIYTHTRVKNRVHTPSAIHINLYEYLSEREKNGKKFTKNEYRDLIIESITMLDKKLVIETNYYIWDRDYQNKIKSAKQRQILITSNRWQNTDSENTDTDTQEVNGASQNTNVNKSTTEHRHFKSFIEKSRFPIIDTTKCPITERIQYWINTTEAIEQKSKIVQLSTINTIVNDVISTDRIDFQWTPVIDRVCFYKHGIDIYKIDEFDYNSYFIFINDKSILNYIATKSTRQNFTKFWFRLSVALVYNTKLEFTTDNIIIAAFELLKKFFIKGIATKNDWIVNANLTKFINKLIQYCSEESIKESLDGIKSDKNGWRFPVSGDTINTEEWINENREILREKFGLEIDGRKTRSDKGKTHRSKREMSVRCTREYKRELKLAKKIRAIELYNDGKSTREIAEALDITHVTVGNWIREYLKGTSQFD